MSDPTLNCSTRSAVPPEFSDSGPLILLTEREVARAVRLSPAMLQKLRREGAGPAFVRIGSAVRYPMPALAEWVTARMSHA